MNGNFAIQRVAIVGAGVSGLAAIRWCKLDGFDCVAFETSSSPGGLWFFEEEVQVGRACCMKSTVLNSSKEVSSFSDFPPSTQSATYMDNQCYHKYLEQYAEHFDLLRHIRFSHRVERITKQGSKWLVRVVSNGKEEQFEFDAVIVCSGNYAHPYVPQWPGMENFKGSITHAHKVREYLCSSKYENKRILVVGVGASGTDAACEAGKVAANVYLVARRGMWVISRYANGGRTIDEIYMNRLMVYIRSLLGPQIVEKIYRKKLNADFSHKLFGLEPTAYGPFDDRPHITDEIWNSLAVGKVQIVRDNIAGFTENGVRFVNGLFLDNIDHVILCTGYKADFPFLSSELFSSVSQIGAEGRLRACARQIVHPEEQTLAFVGFIMPQGPAVPANEMQARVVTSFWRGRITLDQIQTVYRVVSAEERRLFESNPAIAHSSSAMNGSLTHYGTYMDAMATVLGCKPQLWRLFLSDNRLWRELLLSNWTAYQYRLEGPHKWEGARDAIMTLHTRAVYWPHTDQSRYSVTGYRLLSLVLLIIIALLSINSFLL